MPDMDWNVQEAAGWLQEQVDRTLVVIKQEQNDVDRVTLDLREVALLAVESEEERADDYMSPETLVLYGEGMIAGREAAAELPENTFEIPISGGWSCRSMDNGGVVIETGRATYTILPQ